MPGHLCRFAVRARVASPPGLFWEVGVNRIAPSRERSHASPRRTGTARLDAASPTPRSAYLTPHPTGTETSTRGNGISTVCPSPTPFGLGLGPTNPPRMIRAEETSAIRWACLFTGLVLLMPAFSLPDAPPVLPDGLHRIGNAPLPHVPPQRGDASAASAPGLSPGTLSARDHSTSELLRTLSRMAASKPTSWLSGRLHIL